MGIEELIRGDLLVLTFCNKEKCSVFVDRVILEEGVVICKERLSHLYKQEIVINFKYATEILIVRNKISFDFIK